MYGFPNYRILMTVVKLIKASCNWFTFVIAVFSVEPARPRGYETYFMRNAAKLNAYHYKEYQEIKHFSGSDAPRMLFSHS